jgi:prophage tail gpP-like protein
MPKPQEIAVVVAAGQRYDTWESIEIERTYENVVSEMRLTAAEPSNLSQGFAALKLKPKDPAQGYLAGRLAISGYVWLRHSSYDAETHAVQFGIASVVQRTTLSTVDAAPGQYLNSTLAQIAGAVFGKIGVGFSIVGSPPGANKPFERVSEHVGETRFQFIERLARFRNLQLIDDGHGNVLATRGPVGGVAATLQEGRNIKRAQLVLKISETADFIQFVGQNFSNDEHWGDASRDIAASAADPDGNPQTPIKLIAEQPGDAADLQMRVNREVAANSAYYADGTITVQGWLLDDGSLWIEHVGALVTINSPMLVPTGSITLWIKGVIHRQNGESGTETDVLVADHLASGDFIATTGDGDLGGPSLGPAQPDASDIPQGP